VVQDMEVKVIGMDLDKETINYAIQHYYHPLVLFKPGITSTSY